jgi:hypothetical protein
MKMIRRSISLRQGFPAVPLRHRETLTRGRRSRETSGSKRQKAVCKSQNGTSKNNENRISYP